MLCNMRNILIEFGYSLFYVSILFIDNKSGIQGSVITPVYVPSSQNIADLFTKVI